MNEPAKRDGLVAALSLLTIFPVEPLVPGGIAVDAGRRATKWFTLVGAAVGAIVGTTFFIAMSALRVLGADGRVAVVLAALMAVVVDFIITRGMHWDGLADVGDAWWGGFDVDRRQEIMSDSSVGAFGVFAVIAVFAGLIAGLSLFEQSAVALVPAFAISRLAGVFAAQLGQPAKSGGLGRSVLAFGTEYARGGRSAVTWLVSLVVCFISVAVVWVVLGQSQLVGLASASLVSLFGAAAFPHLIATRMGGVTGDVIGASILLTEVVAVVAFAIAI